MSAAEWLIFIVGLMLGGSIGFMGCAALTVAKRSDGIACNDPDADGVCPWRRK